MPLPWTSRTLARPGHEGVVEVFLDQVARLVGRPPDQHAARARRGAGASGRRRAPRLARSPRTPRRRRSRRRRSAAQERRRTEGERDADGDGARPHGRRARRRSRRARPRTPRCSAATVAPGASGHASAAGSAGATASTRAAASRTRRRLSSSARRERSERLSRSHSAADGAADVGHERRRLRLGARDDRLRPALGGCLRLPGRGQARRGLGCSRRSIASVRSASERAWARRAARAARLSRAACSERWPCARAISSAPSPSRRGDRRARSSGPAGRSAGGRSAPGVAVSNSTEALRARGCVTANALSGSRWVVATTRAPRSASSSRIAWARAAPSSGSVPAPSSSRSTSERSSASARISRDLLHERREGREVLGHGLVVADDREDASNTGRREPSAAGTWQPTWAISACSGQRLERDRLAAGVRAR